MGSLNGLAQDLMSGMEDGRPSSVFGAAIHGPRGTGKTALLNAFADGAKVKGARVLGLVGQVLKSHEGLIERIDSLVEPPPERSVSTEGRAGGDARISVPGVNFKAGAGGARTRTEVTPGGLPPSPTVFAALDRALNEGREAGKPLLIAVDEAHASDPAVVGALLNAVQHFGRLAPGVALAMAGTPDLLDLLGDDATQATWFMDRAGAAGRLVPMPNDLPVEEMADALRKIILRCGVPIVDEDAVGPAADSCKGSPYFMQALGHAALTAAKANGDVADFREGTEALEKFQAAVNARYENAWRDLERRGLTTCARQIGALWRAGKPITRRRVRRAISSGLLNNPDQSTLDEQAADAAFKHLGLLWSPSGKDEGPWTVGLPSFFDFVEKKCHEDPDFRAFLPNLEADMERIIDIPATPDRTGVAQASRS